MLILLAALNESTLFITSFNETHTLSLQIRSQFKLMFSNLPSKCFLPNLKRLLFNLVDLNIQAVSDRYNRSTLHESKAFEFFCNI